MQVYRNMYMMLDIRKLRNSATLKAEKRHMRGMGVKDVPGWVNRNLINSLNQEPSPGVQRITKIAEMFQSAHRLSEELRLLDNANAGRSLLRKLNRLVPELNALIFRYTGHPTVFVNRSDGAPLIAYYMCSATTDEEAQEKRAIQFLVENTEIIGRIRRCLECRLWFFAVTDHQKYCADKCRVRHASQSEEFRKKRARYMRERYRPEQKQRDLKAKKLAAGTKGR
jgi:hypothetical protein